MANISLSFTKIKWYAPASARGAMTVFVKKTQGVNSKNGRFWFFENIFFKIFFVFTSTIQWWNPLFEIFFRSRVTIVYAPSKHAFFGMAMLRRVCDFWPKISVRSLNLPKYHPQIISARLEKKFFLLPFYQTQRVAS